MERTVRMVPLTVFLFREMLNSCREMDMFAQTLIPIPGVTLEVSIGREQSGVFAKRSQFCESRLRMRAFRRGAAAAAPT
jgi:hypothetical protein